MHDDGAAHARRRRCSCTTTLGSCIGLYSHERAAQTSALLRRARCSCTTTVLLMHDDGAAHARRRLGRASVSSISTGTRRNRASTASQTLSSLQHLTSKLLPCSARTTHSSHGQVPHRKSHPSSEHPCTCIVLPTSEGVGSGSGAGSGGADSSESTAALPRVLALRWTCCCIFGGLRT